MADRTVSRGVATLAMGLIVSSWLGSGVATAQLVVQPNDLFVSGMQNPRFPPAGDWAEVVTVTSKWLVIQNQAGQQFPVALDSIAQFVIRWPTVPELISGNALVEATGIDLGSNQIRTDHVDVFEGSARSLVQPIYQQIVGYNRTPTAFDIQNKNIYGIYIPLLPGEDQIPNRLHVCGPVAGLNPLRIVVGGNNAVAVYPSATGLFYSQVTPGTSSFLRERDLVYVIPTDITPKSLVLGQLVGYKSMPFSQFVP